MLPILITVISALLLCSLAFALGAIWHGQSSYQCPQCKHYFNHAGPVSRSICPACANFNAIAHRKLSDSLLTDH